MVLLSTRAVRAVDGRVLAHVQAGLLLNRNLPFNQFTIEQLAGDLLPGATLDQRIATGFNRNHRGNAEGGIVPEEYAVEYVADRVETTSTSAAGA